MEMMKQMEMPPPPPPPPQPPQPPLAGSSAWFAGTKPLAALVLFTFVLLLTVLTGAHRGQSFDALLSRAAEVSEGGKCLVPLSNPYCL